MRVKEICQKILKLIMVFAVVLNVFVPITHADTTSSVVLVPEDNQYLELRAIEVKEVSGQNKQLIMQLWGHNLKFKGFDVRFSYDSTKVQPSNITTNVISTKGSTGAMDFDPDYFKFESEFQGKLEFWSPGYDSTGSGIRAVVDFDEPSITEHIIETTDNDSSAETAFVVDTKGDLLVGTMSFQMLEGVDVFDVSWFSLVGGSSSPETGIQIDYTMARHYTAQSTFRFTDMTASKDANLSNIVLSNGEINEDDPSESTYKEYTLTPTFDKDTTSYEIELLDYIDDMDLTATQSDENATMKVKVPKRDDDDKLVYEDDETTIVYEEKTLTDGVPLNVIINKLGEPDTVLTITVTAEDAKTTKEYTVTIKRPFATIKGSIYTAPTAALERYTSNIKLYNSSDVATVVNWSNLSNEEERANLHSNMTSLDSIDFVTNDDGTYEIYVIPRQYDIVLDKGGYLDHIYKERTLEEGDVLDLGLYELLGGDVDKDGLIDLTDSSLINSQYLLDQTSSDFDTYVHYDFNEDLIIDLTDLSILNSNYLCELEVE